MANGATEREAGLAAVARQEKKKNAARSRLGTPHPMTWWDPLLNKQHDNKRQDPYMGNAQLQQKLQFFVEERRRVYEAMMSVIRTGNINHRANSPGGSAAQVWNDLQAEYGRLEQDIQDAQRLLARYRRPD